VQRLFYTDLRLLSRGRQVEFDTTSSLAAAAFALCIEKTLRGDAWFDLNTAARSDLHFIFRAFHSRREKRQIFIACLRIFPASSLIFLEVRMDQ
jgi:hypothetical protein